MPKLTQQLEIEYRALTTGCGVVDVSDRSQIELTGKDRVSFLNGFCTNDIRRLETGSGCEVFLTNVKGKLVGFGFVFCHADSLVIESVSGQADHIVPHLDRYLITDDVELIDRSASWAELFVSGTESEQTLAAVFGNPSPTEMLSHAVASCDGSEVAIHRVPLALEPAFLLSCDRDATEAVVAQLNANGVIPCSSDALEIKRVEAAFPDIDRDITEQNLPQEVGRDATAISFTKGCYLGQETVARLDAMGHVNRQLAMIRWLDADAAIPNSAEELRVGDQVVGRVTSAVWSPKYAASLALAMVRVPHQEPGTRLESESGEAEVISG